MKLANYLIKSIVYSSKKFSSPSKITKCWTEKVKDLLDCIQRRNSSLFKDNRTTPNYQSQNSIIQETFFTIKITWTKRRDEKSKTKRLRKIYSDNCVRQISGKFQTNFYSRRIIEPLPIKSIIPSKSHHQNKPKRNKKKKKETKMRNTYFDYCVRRKLPLKRRRFARGIEPVTGEKKARSHDERYIGVI